MEIERLSSRLSRLSSKQRKSPENGDWKFKYPLCHVFACHLETKKISWKWRLKDCLSKLRAYREFLRNKENLLKMEIERPLDAQPSHCPVARNKENLLKMEIESWITYTSLYLCLFPKQRKSPENGDWKWLCPHCKPLASFCETKKISWKWRLKAVVFREKQLILLDKKQRKSPENGDWKLFDVTAVFKTEDWETKKISWKWRLKVTYTPMLLWPVHPRNKENLLKMEIESCFWAVHRVCC